MHPDSCARHNNRRINNSTIIKRLELVPKLTSARARTANDKHECIRTNTQRTRSFLTLFSDCFWHHLLVSRNCFTITDDLRICAFISWLALFLQLLFSTLNNCHYSWWSQGCPITSSIGLFQSLCSRILNVKKHQNTSGSSSSKVMLSSNVAMVSNIFPVFL